MIKSIIITIACSLALFLNSCNVTCEYTCVDDLGYEYTGTATTRRSKCDDCNFARVNALELAGEDCTCREE